MLVDSYKFLPRSFRPMFENAKPLPGEDEPVWAPFETRLADATIALLSSAGLSVDGEQEPFDLDRERAEPTWGDPSWRAIPHDATVPLAMSHLHVNNADVLADRNVALPVDLLDELIAEQRVGAAAGQHVSVMGYQQFGVEGWRNHTGPEIVEFLRDQRVHGVVLAPV